MPAISSMSKRSRREYLVHKTLSNYLGKPASASAPPAFPPFDSEKAKSLEFFEIISLSFFNFLPVEGRRRGFEKD